MLSRSVVSDSSRFHGLQPTRLLHPWDFPWDFPGKSTGVGCHCLLRINILVWLNLMCHFFRNANGGLWASIIAWGGGGWWRRNCASWLPQMTLPRESFLLLPSHKISPTYKLCITKQSWISGKENIGKIHGKSGELLEYWLGSPYKACWFFFFLNESECIWPFLRTSELFSLELLNMGWIHTEQGCCKGIQTLG